MALNLEKQLRFYGAYHNDPVNIGIHVACVPVILWTAFVLVCTPSRSAFIRSLIRQCTNSPTLIPVPDTLTIPNLDLNLGTIVCLAYCSLYVLLEPVAGTALAVLLLAGTAFGKYLTATYGSTVNYWATGAHVVCWIAQFVGHGKYEGRAPALLDNLFQAIFLAPLFVWLEILFAAGYREELKKRVEKGVQQDIAKFKATKSNGTANGHVKAS